MRFFFFSRDNPFLLAYGDVLRACFSARVEPSRRHAAVSTRSVMSFYLIFADHPREDANDTRLRAESAAARIRRVLSCFPLLLSRGPPRSRADDDHRFPRFPGITTRREPSLLTPSSNLPGGLPARLRGRLLLRPRSGERVRGSRRSPLTLPETGRGVVVAEEDFGDAFARDGGGGGAADAARRDADRPRVEGRTRGSARGRRGRHARGRRRAGRGARGGEIVELLVERWFAVDLDPSLCVFRSVSVSVGRVPTATPNQRARSVFARVGGAGPNGVARSDIGIPSQELAALARAKGLRAESTFVSEGTFFCFRRARLTSSSPENHGIRVKRLRQNDPSEGVSQKAARRPRP